MVDENLLGWHSPQEEDTVFFLEVDLAGGDSPSKFFLLPKSGVSLAQSPEEAVVIQTILAAAINDAKSEDAYRLRQPPQVGSLTAVKWDDGIFYRAMVLDYLDRTGDLLSVRLIDAGKEGAVNKDDCFTLPPKLLNVAPQALCCSLLDWKEDQDDREVRTSFKKMFVPPARVFACPKPSHATDISSPEYVADLFVQIPATALLMGHFQSTFTSTTFREEHDMSMVKDETPLQRHFDAMIDFEEKSKHETPFVNKQAITEAWVSSGTISTKPNKLEIATDGPQARGPTLPSFDCPFTPGVARSEHQEKEHTQKQSVKPFQKEIVVAPHRVNSSSLVKSVKKATVPPLHQSAKSTSRSEDGTRDGGLNSGVPDGPDKPFLASKLGRISAMEIPPEIHFLLANTTSPMMPNHFHVHVLRHPLMDSFPDLMMQLSLFWKEPVNCGPLQLRGLATGTMLAVNEFSGEVHRGEYKRELGDQGAEVFLVDYGDTIEVAPERLRLLPAKFCQPPPLALKCSLHGVKPPNLDGCFPPEASQIFAELSGQELTAVVTKKPENELESFELEVTMPNNKNLAVALAKKGLVKDVFDVVEECNPAGVDPMKEDYYALANTYGSPLNHLQLPKEPQTCRFFRDKGSCLKGDVCPLLHAANSPGQPLGPSEFRTSAHKELHVPSNPDAQMVVRVSHISRPDSFCCILPWGPVDLSLTVSDVLGQLEKTGASENLDQLTERMTKHYEAHNFTGRRVEVFPSELVAVKNRDNRGDISWVRARVIEFDSSNRTVTVKFVDSGHPEHISLADVRTLEPQFLHLPLQAFECSLAGVAPMNSISWSLDESKCFAEIVGDGKDFVASVRPRTCTGTDACQVTLRTLDECEGQEGPDVGEAMIAKGFARRAWDGDLKEGTKICPG